VRSEGVVMTHQYVAGTCNIGPDEIAMRRRAGHVGVVTTATLAAGLIRSDLHPAWRLEHQVTADQDLAQDRRKALQIAAASGAIGVGVALASMLA
jgi:hypothetical protein